MARVSVPLTPEALDMKTPAQDLVSVLRAMKRADDDLSDAAIAAAYEHCYDADEWYRPLTTNEAASFLGVTPQSLYNWKAGSGDCPPCHVRIVDGKRFYRWGSRAELRAWLLDKADAAERRAA